MFIHRCSNSQHTRNGKSIDVHQLIMKMLFINTVKYYSAIQKNEMMKFSDKQMDLEIIVLGGVIHILKDTNYIVFYM